MVHFSKEDSLILFLTYDKRTKFGKGVRQKQKQTRIGCHVTLGSKPLLVSDQTTPFFYLKKAQLSGGTSRGNRGAHITKYRHDVP